MSMAIQGGISPEEIIAFIQEHTEAYAAQIKGEMQAAQDRTGLVKDIADLASKMEDYKTRGDWVGFATAISNFAEKHEEAWGGAAHDMVPWLIQAVAWAGGRTVNAYNETINPDATDFRSSYSASPDTKANWNDDIANDAKSMASAWIQQLTDWKDEISGDDKIGMMKLQEDADRLKNLYELGSNLIAKVEGCASSIIANIGRA
jgi:hypothetical protein